MFPAAFDYVRATRPRTRPCTFCAARRRGPGARGRPEPVPAMRFRLARPGVLVDINPARELDYLRLDDGGSSSARWRATPRLSARRGLASGAGACSRTSRASSPIRSFARWARSSAACATTIPPATGRLRRSPRAPTSTCAAPAASARSPSTRSSWTASRPRVADGELAVEARFPVPDDRTAGAYLKIERKVGDFATAAAAVQLSLAADGTIRQAGDRALGRRPCAARVDDAERLLAGQGRRPTCIARPPTPRRAAASRRATSAAASNTRRHLAGVLVARGLRQALERLGVQA